MSQPYEADDIYHPSGGGSAYTHSTGPGIQDATVVDVQVGNNFVFKPLAAGNGITIDEVTNPGSITFTNSTSLQDAYDNGSTIQLAADDLIIASAANDAVVRKTVSNQGIFTDGNLILQFPDLPIFADVVYVINIVFIGVNIANQESFSISFDIKLDPFNPVFSSRLLQKKIKLSPEDLDIEASYSPFNVNFILRCTGNYRISWHLTSFENAK